VFSWPIVHSAIKSHIKIEHYDLGRVSHIKIEHYDLGRVKGHEQEDEEDEN
jgi:hypothetical protein